MNGLMLKLYAKTASFRDPGAQLYHDTVPLPPPSTIVGIAGAALGLSFEDALSFFKENKIKVGCTGKSGGKGRDLWNYIKIKSKDFTHAIILRNFLYDIAVNIFYACEENEVILKLYNAFSDPVYALTLGNSDELAKVCCLNIFENIKIEQRNVLKNTWAPGDLSKKLKIDWDTVKKSKVNITLEPLVVKNLPCDFETDNKGVRKATKYKDITFIGENHLLQTETDTFLFADQCVPMLEIS